MKFTELVALAKAGYSLADIKELQKLADESEAIETPQPTTVETVEGEDPTVETPNLNTESVEEDEATPDYKKLYEDSLIKLAEAQKVNINQPMPKSNDEESLASAIRSFM